MNDNTLSLKDAFSHLIKQYGLEDTFFEQKIKEVWAKTVGEYCNSFTSKIILKKNVLTVHISNAAVKSELSYVKTEIIAKINELLGKEIVKQLKIF